MNLRLIAAVALAGISALAAGAKDKDKPKETVSRPAPQFLIDNSPVDREATMRVSFASVVKRVQSAVVYISSTKQVKSQTRDMSQLFQDPNFRRFFGPMLPNPGQGGGGGDGSGGRAPKTERQESLGSGVIISPNGYVLTNNHVVEGADEVKVRFGEPRKEFKATVIGRDAEADVAVLKIEATGLPAATLGDSDQLQVGDTVLAIGDPFDIGLTVTHGIVSALGRNNLQLENFEDFIQTDAPINPGNSGGALLDTKGRVVGMNTAILSHSGGSNGVGFAIPINLVRSIADQLIRTGKVARGFLGVNLNPEITPDLAEEFGSATGALVTDVTKDSPAEKAGIKSGDILTKLNGKVVADTPQLRLAISELIPGTTVTLEYLRNGKTATATVKLGDRSADKSLAGGDSKDAGAAGDDSGVLNGVAVTDITPEVRTELHIPPNVKGALISDVDPESASALASEPLQKGDVLLDLNRKPVRSADEAIKLSAQIAGPKVVVHFWRSGAVQYVVIDESKSAKSAAK